MRAPESLPAPRAPLAGCVWLPRIMAKVDQIRRGELPAEYAARFCDRDSVDSWFLDFFGMAQDDLVAAAARFPAESDRAVWFLAQPGIHAERIAEWNRFAANLGRPGFPMADRLQAVLPTTYRHVDARQVHSIFELLEADESCA